MYKIDLYKSQFAGSQCKRYIAPFAKNGIQNTGKPPFPGGAGQQVTHL